MNLIKSKRRVADHGEVFTPPWLVEKMLDLVKGETERIDSRFLEPACGSGNFLVPVLQRKLAAVEAKFGSGVNGGSELAKAGTHHRGRPFGFAQGRLRSLGKRGPGDVRLRLVWVLHSRKAAARSG